MLPCKKDTISHTATQSHVRIDRFPQKRQDLTSKYGCYYRISRETICNTTPATKQAGDFSGSSTLPVWSPATKQACDQTGAKTPASSVAGDQTGRRLFRRQQGGCKQHEFQCCQFQYICPVSVHMYSAVARLF